MKYPSSPHCLKWGLLLLIVCIRLYDVRTREELHPDEIYSVLIAQCNPAFYEAIPDGEYSGTELLSQLIANHSFKEDISRLYANNCDVPHASLYYMMLRCCLSSLSEWNPARIALTGGLLNILFIVIAYFLLWKLIMRLTSNNLWLTSACCAMAFLNPASGECAVLVREYQLAMLGVIWFSYTLYSVYQRVKNGEYKSGIIRNLAPLTLSFALCMSSGYLNSFYLILLPLGLFINLLICKRSCALKFFTTVFLAGVAGLIFSWLIYTGYFHFISDNSVHKSKAFTSLYASLSVSLERDILNGALTLPFAVALLIVLVLNIACHFSTRLNKIKNNEVDGNDSTVMLVIAIASVLSVIAVQYTSLLRQARYSYPYLPLLCVLIPLCLSGLSQHFRKAVSLCIIVYFSISALVIPPTKYYGWATQRALLKGGAVLHNLNANELPLVYPLLTPDANYRVEHTPTFPYEAESAIIIHGKPSTQMTTGKEVIRISGPLRIINRK